MDFKLHTRYQPTGDQPTAIKKLVESIEKGNKHQTLLGVTGSGKTFTMANVIEKTQKPTLVVAHNKTLAAQLYQELRDYFPENAVSYFVSYYDYYQPEAYIPSSDTYIEKEADINDEIDKLRLAATTNLLTRKDTIVVASVSCIYNLGSPVEYGKNIFRFVEGEVISQQSFLLRLSQLQYERSTTDLKRGSVRIKGDTIQIWPAYLSVAITIETLENTITKITEIDPISGQVLPPTIRDPLSHQYTIHPAKHYTMNPKTQDEGIKEIERDLATRVAVLEKSGKKLEGYRLQQKVNYDLEMIREFGFVNGIENYSRHFDGRKPGEPPFTLLDYFNENAKLFNKDSFLTIVDESHMTVSQVKGMFHGDRSRKETLIDYGFRLPSALDNRPLQLHEFLERTPQNIYMSATPNDWELQKSGENVAEQLIRPTGLTDPVIKLRPTTNQIEDLVIEVIRRKQLGQRVLVTTLTKKMAEALTDYLNDAEKIKSLIKDFKQRRKEINPETPYQQNQDLLPIDKIEVGPLAEDFYIQLDALDNYEPKEYPKVAYLHSDIQTLERSDILDDLREGKYDVLVGINLLREGLDLPEVSLVAILDADKEGFLRSTTSMVQTMGRAARHEEGKAILFADKMTKSMKKAIEETQRRRETQVAYNIQYNITPKGINKPIREKLLVREDENIEEKKYRKGKGMVVKLSKKSFVDLDNLDPEALLPAEKEKMIKKLDLKMRRAAVELDFELAAILRDKIKSLST